MDSDKLAAYQTLYTCLETVALLIAPISPFYADLLYRDLTLVTKENKNSVHLAKFPEADTSLINSELEEQMQSAQKITSMVLALRRKASIKVRQPLSTIMIPVLNEHQKEVVNAMSLLILSEVNVKAIKFVGNEDGVLVKKVKPDFKKLGPKFGKNMSFVAKSIAAMSQNDILEFEKNGKISFDINGTQAEVEVCDVEIISEDIPGWLVSNDDVYTVALDITVTDELKKEGIAREIVNRIQNIRKDKDFDITDRIKIEISSNESTDAAIKQYEQYISKQVLADEIVVKDVVDAEDAIELDMDDCKLLVSVKR